MSINEAVADALTDYAVAWRDSEGVACIKIATELRAAIEQHVAEAVKAEREVCLNACDSARLSQNSRFGFDEIISMAREAGFHAWYSTPEREYHFGCVTKFAALVAAREREEFLHLVDDYAKDNVDLKAAIRAHADNEVMK